MNDAITEACERLFDLHNASPYGTAQLSNDPAVHPPRALRAHQQWRDRLARRSA